MPFFGNGLTMFGLMGFIVVVTGGLVGGVIGVLLPKTSAGAALGSLLTLFICTVYHISILSDEILFYFYYFNRILDKHFITS